MTREDIIKLEDQVIELEKQTLITYYALMKNNEEMNIEDRDFYGTLRLNMRALYTRLATLSSLLNQRFNFYDSLEVFEGGKEL